MAGPVVAALGPFAFEAHGFGLTDIKRNLRTPWASLKTAGGLDQLQWTGGESDEVEIGGVLFPHVYGGLASLSGIRGAAESGQPLPLVNLAGQVFGQHVVETVSEDRTFLDSTGLPMRDAYKLSLKRYGGGSFSPISVLIGLF